MITEERVHTSRKGIGTGEKKTLREMLRHRPRLRPRLFTTIAAQAAT